MDSDSRKTNGLGYPVVVKDAMETISPDSSGRSLRDFEMKPSIS